MRRPVYPIRIIAMQKVQQMTDETIYFVLWDDGSWGGGFRSRRDAEACAEKPWSDKRKNMTSQIVEGHWFPLHQQKDVI